MSEAADKQPKVSAFDKKIAEQTATTAVQLGVGLVDKIKQWAKLKLDVRDAMKKYAEAYRERYGEVKVLGTP